MYASANKTMQFELAKCLLRPNQIVCACTRSQHAAKIASSPDVKPFSEIPQPKRLPVLGTILDYTKYRGFKADKFDTVVKRRHQELGPIYKESVLPGLTDFMVFTSSAKDVETMFRMNERYPQRPPLDFIILSRQSAGYGIGVSNTQGDEWLQIRKLFNEHLLTNKSIWNYTEEHLEISMELADHIRKNLNEKYEVDDLNNLLYQWALECATAFTLDLKLGAFKENMSVEGQEIIDVTKNIFSLWNDLMMIPPIYKYINISGKFKTLCRYQAQQYEAIKNFIEKHSQTPSTLMNIVEESDLSPKEKATLVPEVLGAAVETTSGGMGLYLYALANNPEKQEILREEIRNTSKAGAITGKTLRQMRYLHAVHLEVDRMYPRIFGFPRKIPQDMVFSGYQVPKGTFITSTANLTNNRDPSYFDNPDEFLPERWLSGKDRKKLVMPGSFGMGARRCPGRMMAHQEIACLTIVILSKFKIEYHHEPLDLSYRLTSSLSNEPRFTFVPIDDR